MSLVLAILFGVPLQDRAQFGLQNSSEFFGGFLQEGAAGVDAADVQVQVLLRGARVAAVLAHVQLVPPLLVGVLLLHAVDLLQVRLQRAALREGLVANLALVRTNACSGKRQRLPVVSPVSQVLVSCSQLRAHQLLRMYPAAQGAASPNKTSCFQAKVFRNGLIYLGIENLGMF